MAEAAPAAAMPELVDVSLENEDQRLAHAERCLALSTKVGWAHYDLPKWILLLRGCSELFMLQREDGSIAGCLLRTSFPVAACSGSDFPAFSMFGMMLVDTDCRGQGLAKRLIKSFEKRAGALGHACGLGVATADGFPVYAKHGYHVAVADSTVCKLVASASAAAAMSTDDFMVEVHVDTQPRLQVLETVDGLDQAASGLVRTRQLECLCALPGVAAVARGGEAGEVVGALLATVDSQTGAMNLGPVLGDEAAAEALISAVAGTLPPETSVSIMVLDHSDFVESLKSQGFSAPGGFKAMAGTMVLGEAKIPGDRSRYIGMINPCFG